MENDKVNAAGYTSGAAGLSALAWARDKMKHFNRLKTGPMTAGLKRADALDETRRNELESVLGYDLKGARIHEDKQAGEMARRLDADAFTIGADIYAAEGKLSGTTRESKGLLVHELVHVIQQTHPMPLSTMSAEREQGDSGDPDFFGPTRRPGSPELTHAPAPQLASTGSRVAAGGTRLENMEKAAEAAEKNVIRAAQGTATPGGAVPADAHEVADKVYLLMQRELLLERDRTGR